VKYLTAGDLRKLLAGAGEVPDDTLVVLEVPCSEGCGHMIELGEEVSLSVYNRAPFPGVHGIDGRTIDYRTWGSLPVLLIKAS